MKKKDGEDGSDRSHVKVRIGSTAKPVRRPSPMTITIIHQFIDNPPMARMVYFNAHQVTKIDQLIDDDLPMTGMKKM